MNPYLGEFIGTSVLLYFGNGVNAATSLEGSYAKGAGWLAVCIGWGLAVTLGVYAVGGISGAHMNPAVTLGLWVAGDFPTHQIAGYILAQLAGGVFGASMAFFHFQSHFNATADPAAKLGVFATGPAISYRFTNLFSEFMGTFALLFGLLYIGANEFTEGLNPLVVGGLIVAIGLSFGGTTGFAINPARDLGPRIAHAILPIRGKGSSNWAYAWIPVLGPIAGGMTGAAAYEYLYENQITAWLWIGIVSVVLLIFVSIGENRSSEVK